MLHSEALEKIERMYPTLRVCPFCGGKSSPNSSSNLVPWTQANKVWIECDSDNCGARGPKVSIGADLISAYINAIHKWRIRCW